MSYDVETRRGYQSLERAAAYQRDQSRRLTWMRLMTWCEHRAVRRILRRYRWSAADRVLDVPCGTGALARALNAFPFRVVASDIAAEMMQHGRGAYAPATFRGFVRADLTALGLRRAAFAAAVVLGFMHRVPSAIRTRALAELAAVVSRVAVVSFSEDNSVQRWKRRVLAAVQPQYKPAPAPADLRQVIREIEDAGFVVRERTRLIPFLSSEVLFVLEKSPAQPRTLPVP